MAQSSIEWPGTADDGFAPGNDTVLQVFGKKRWEREKMCQENNSAEAKLQK